MFAYAPMIKRFALGLLAVSVAFGLWFARYYAVAREQESAPLEIAWAATQLSLTGGTGMVLKSGSDGKPTRWLGRSQEDFSSAQSLRLKDQLGGGLVFEDSSGRELRYTSRKLTRAFWLLEREETPRF